MKIIVKSWYGEKSEEFPMNTMEDLADFLSEYPSATHAAISMGLGNLEQMAQLAAKYLSNHHMDVELVKD